MIGQEVLADSAQVYLIILMMSALDLSLPVLGLTGMSHYNGMEPKLIKHS